MKEKAEVQKEESRYVIVTPVYDYTAHPDPEGLYPVMDPVLTKEGLEAELRRRAMTNSLGPCRVYEIKRYVPVTMGVSLDGTILGPGPIAKDPNGYDDEDYYNE